jgi:hypothetical protein
VERPLDGFFLLDLRFGSAAGFVVDVGETLLRLV